MPRATSGPYNHAQDCVRRTGSVETLARMDDGAHFLKSQSVSEKGLHSNPE